MAKDRPPLKHSDYLKIAHDYEAAASVANLVYVNDKDPGIARVKKGKGFSYTLNEKVVDDEATLDRIKKLVLPPAWTNVWICKSPNGHIQATGFDVRGRKQYKYHPRWTSIQQETKFHRMFLFGKVLPQIRKKMQRDLAQEGFPESKVLASVVGVMERTYIRVGNNGYEKLYGSYGLTTLKNKHVEVKGDTVTFSFKGKKGVYHKISLKSKKFARIIKQCRAIPGKELFQYYDSNGEVKKVDSGHVNQYLKECADEEVTTKDFRTWAGTLMMMRILKAAPPCETQTEFQKIIVDGFKQVSQRLGNTVAVCKKYYVHPEMINLYQHNQLGKIFTKTLSPSDSETGLTAEENMLMKILKAIQKEQANPKLTEKLLKESIRRSSRKREKRKLAA
jgi:DNA topoisomerase I